MGVTPLLYQHEKGSTAGPTTRLLRDTFFVLKNSSLAMYPPLSLGPLFLSCRVPRQVLSFKSAGACRLVAEHVEERREAILAFRTMGLVEMFRKVAAMSTNNNTGIFI